MRIGPDGALQVARNSGSRLSPRGPQASTLRTGYVEQSRRGDHMMAVMVSMAQIKSAVSVALRREDIRDCGARWRRSIVDTAMCTEAAMGIQP